ncbi:GNAT family N-acetyltransferase [Bacillus sp. AFS015802]|uniref:GNAT family N-acetyltransferase n=1 Tax=Bacillus sp. AFS015802 TaxID=2033486 RepID=UPI000BFA8463|nr:GNAT family N-acetyltransferase [Bacillus sp. AFS015802]PFA63952.1 GNAT family N-acetyltransferase [Bacillus sp. AFS015802]
MKKITFDHIYNPGHVVAENALYKHIHFPEMLTRYDSNFLAFKRQPTVEEFKDAAVFLRKFHQSKGQKHVKFLFPQDHKPSEELLNYFKQEGYEIGFNELYVIEPDQFPVPLDNPDIEVREVTEDELDAYLAFQYEQDMDYGPDFADQKVDMHKRNFESPRLLQLLAFYKGTPAGSVDVIIDEDSAEIDGLMVHETFQKKGIGSRLQQFVMERFPDRKVILVADGEDTPRVMYQKQNYTYSGFRYEVQKVYE